MLSADRPRQGACANATLAEGPNFGYVDIDGEELDEPWRSEQFEAGGKLRVFTNLWLTLAAFQITQKDVPELDPLDPTDSSYVLNGENRSRGVEATLSGELTPDWSWWGSYTYCEYEDIDAGIDFERFPAHSASLWTAYRLPGGPLQGLRSGIGLRAKSKYYTTFRGAYLGDDYEIVLVNDGSPDNSLDLAIQLAESDGHVVVVDLSRNFGHHKAMIAGLEHALGERVFLIDSDLEEEPEWLLEFSSTMAVESVDVVYGVQLALSLIHI